MKYIYLLLAIFVLSACNAKYIKGSEGMEDKDLAILWLHQDILVKTMLDDYNGQKIPAFLNSVIKDIPGKKRLKVTLQSLYEDKETRENYRVSFSFNEEFKAGYSYNFMLTSVNYMNLSKETELCLLEELHNSKGSQINPTGEFRSPSSNAKTVSCSEAIFTEYK